MNSTQEQAEQEKLIEKIGECYPYLDYRTKMKIEMYYANRSIYTLNSLKGIIKQILNKYETIGENQLEFEKLFSIFYRLLKPVLPLIFILIVIIVGVSNFIIFHDAKSNWEKYCIVSDYASILFSLTILISLINLVLQKWSEFRNPGLRFWIGTFVVIVCPYVILLIDSNYLYLAFVIQILCIIILLVLDFKVRESR